MPFFGLVLFFVLASCLAIATITTILKYIKTRNNTHLKKLVCLLSIPAVLVGMIFYNHYPITKEIIVGTYYIDANFYPGSDANWQKEHFSFEITESDEFLFHEKLEDGNIKTIKGSVEYFRHSPPMLFRIHLEEHHPLIDEHPSLYRGNRKFYYVFESKFGNMFYRKVDS